MLKLSSMQAFLLCYAAGQAFGVMHNSVLILGIGLFSVSFFSLLMSWTHFRTLPEVAGFPFGAAHAFLVLTVICLALACLPGLVTAVLQHRPLALMEHYTTEVTYVRDLGLVEPSALLAITWLRDEETGWISVTRPFADPFAAHGGGASCAISFSIVCRRRRARIRPDYQGGHLCPARLLAACIKRKLYVALAVG